MNKKIVSILIASLLVVGLITALIFIGVSERKRTKDFKTPEEWALHFAKEDFFYIREKDELYIYTITKMNVGNVGEIEADYIDIYEIIMQDNQLNKEYYRIVIQYNLDKSITTAFRKFFGGENIIGEQHIVYTDLDEVNDD